MLNAKLLTEFYGRGGICMTGELFSYVQIEVRDMRLLVTGRTEPRDNGSTFTDGGTEYRYILETEPAERLLRALSWGYPDKPEEGILEAFNLCWRARELAEYLDGLEIPYQYEEAEGGVSDL